MKDKTTAWIIYCRSNLILKGQTFLSQDWKALVEWISGSSQTRTVEYGEDHNNVIVLQISFLLGDPPEEGVSPI